MYTLEDDGMALQAEQEVMKFLHDNSIKRTYQCLAPILEQASMHATACGQEGM